MTKEAFNTEIKSTVAAVGRLQQIQNRRSQINPTIQRDIARLKTRIDFLFSTNPNY
jgi:hypothetical protein